MDSAAPDAIACPYCDPEDNQFMKRMRVRAAHELKGFRNDGFVVAVYRCERCGRTRDETFEK
jgi:uncharacterized Zn finger protein